MALWHMGLFLVTTDQEEFLNYNFHTLLVRDKILRTEYKKYLDVSLIPEIYRSNKYYYQEYNEDMIFPFEKLDEESKRLQNIQVEDINSVEGMNSVEHNRTNEGFNDKIVFKQKNKDEENCNQLDENNIINKKNLEELIDKKVINDKINSFSSIIQETIVKENPINILEYNSDDSDEVVILDVLNELIDSIVKENESNIVKEISINEHFIVQMEEILFDESYRPTIIELLYQLIDDIVERQEDINFSSEIDKNRIFLEVDQSNEFLNRSDKEIIYSVLNNKINKIIEVKHQEELSSENLSDNDSKFKINDPEVNKLLKNFQLNTNQNESVEIKDRKFEEKEIQIEDNSKKNNILDLYSKNEIIDSKSNKQIEEIIKESKCSKNLEDMVIETTSEDTLDLQTVNESNESEFIKENSNSSSYSSQSSSQSISPLPSNYPLLFNDHNFLKLVNNLFDERISPGLMPDEKLKNQPKTFISVCEFDARKDEGLIYAERLKKAGNFVELKYYENGYHGNIHSNSAVGLQMKYDLIQFVNDHI